MVYNVIGNKILMEEVVMNKTLKKILAVVLAVMMVMTFAAVAFATDGEVAAQEEPRFIFQILFDMLKEFWGMIRYIFYDVFLGVPA